MENSILNNIQTENTWIDVETLAKLKGVTKRAVRISINKYEYRTENTRGGKSYKIKLKFIKINISRTRVLEDSKIFALSFQQKVCACIFLV